MWLDPETARLRWLDFDYVQLNVPGSLLERAASPRLPRASSTRDYTGGRIVGTVRDSLEAGLPGARVFLEGSGTEVLADAQGR